MNVCNIGTNQFLIEEIWHQSEGYDFCNSKLGKLLKAQSLGLFIVAIHDTDIYIYMLAPPPQNLCFHIVMREIGQQKHVRAILSIPVMVRHRRELYLSRDG